MERGKGREGGREDRERRQRGGERETERWEGRKTRRVTGSPPSTSDVASSRAAFLHHKEEVNANSYSRLNPIRYHEILQGIPQR